jgi:hypothetical protein
LKIVTRVKCRKPILKSACSVRRRVGKVVNQMQFRTGGGASAAHNQVLSFIKTRERIIKDVKSNRRMIVVAA